MKRLWQLIGTSLFWLAWLVWFVYFRMRPQRSRILVTYKDEVLLVKGWLSQGKWSLPGGGAHPHEDIAVSAVRELQEEVGITTTETALRHLGKFMHKSLLLRYHAHYFQVELDSKLEPQKRWPEISDAAWFRLSDIRGRMLEEDAAYALKQYVPLDQTSLL